MIAHVLFILQQWLAKLLNVSSPFLLTILPALLRGMVRPWKSDLGSAFSRSAFSWAIPTFIVWLFGGGCAAAVRLA